jgi:hypothetical protein
LFEGQMAFMLELFVTEITLQLINSIHGCN